jgi:membrane protease YdiL (CAAX protease family)
MSRRRWFAVGEVAVAAAVVLLDLLIPSLVLVLLAGFSLTLRRESPVSLGLGHLPRGRLVVAMLAAAVVWSLVQVGLTMPVANHLSGREQDVSQFEDVQGDVAMLLAFVVLSWTLAAFVEELAFRGLLLARLREVLGPSTVALAVAVGASSLLFGVLHSEQGVVGVVLVGLDAVVLCLVRLHYDTLWASILLHGFINTLGFVTFFVVGPVHGLW